ncbi:MAG TPA: hypothetical protein VND93_24885 [Myxococcales bacterium]|jgi:hypothetical protein|nr:hypothetical protein [Myxococcales bacterium]
MPVDPATLCTELPVRWTEDDMAAIERELRPYTAMFEGHLGTGDGVPCHIPGSGCLQAPVTSIADPHQLFQDAAAGGAGVGSVRYEVREYPDYWMTIHPSDTDRQPPVPVPMLLLKRPRWPLPALEELRARCAEVVGARVGLSMFLACNLPRFSWDLHTDDEYEAVCSRVHLPLRTTKENLFVWAESRRSAWGDWLLATHLEKGRLYQVRTDVPHTVINRHPTDPRLHLILDIEGPFRALPARA